MPDCGVAASSPGVDYERQGARYQRTRGRTTGTAAYEEPVRRELADAPDGPVLDVGSGTGVWSRCLAAWTGRAVLAIEPAAGMRSVAATGGATLTVGGQAGALPVRDGAGAGAWLSTVIHHVGDLDACARDLRRAMAPGAPVLVRNAFPGRYGGIPMVRYFPGSRRALDRFPSVDAVREAFAGAGFGFGGIGQVEERHIDLSVWREVLPHQRVADTALVHLSDDEFAAGLRAIDEAIAAGRPPEPVALDLMILR